MKQFQSDRGIALITVLLIVSILIAIAVELNRSSRSEIYEAANISDGILLTCIAKSGFYAGAALLVNSPSDVVSLRDQWTKTEVLSAKSTSLFPDGYFIVNIEDEAGKIPLNKLVNGAEYNPDIKKILINLLSQQEFGLDERRAADIVETIKEYIRIKTIPLDCIEELLMVKGITRELISGTKEKPGIGQYLTVYGDGSININTAPKMVLRSLDLKITVDVAEKMDEYRKNAVNDLSISSWNQKFPDLVGKPLATRSSYFQITATGKKNEMTRNINGVIKKMTERKAYQIMSWRQE